MRRIPRRATRTLPPALPPVVAEQADDASLIYYVGLCSTCWVTFGSDALVMPVEDVCPVCRDTVLLLFTPEREMVPFVRRMLAWQRQRMRATYAGMQYALALRGPTYLRRNQAQVQPLQIMQEWDTSVVEFWPAVGQFLHEELVARVTSDVAGGGAGGEGGQDHA